MIKKIIVLTILTVFGLGFSDMPVSGYYSVRNSQAFLINTEEFPKYDFYAYVNLMNFFIKHYKITADTQLVSGYKHNNLRIVAIKKNITNSQQKLLQEYKNPLILDFCNISPYGYGIYGCYIAKNEEKAVSARLYYKIAKIENKTVYVYLYKKQIGSSDSVLKTEFYKEPEIFTYPNYADKKILQYQSIITNYFQQYKNIINNSQSIAEYTLYINKDRTFSLSGCSRSYDDSYSIFFCKMDNSLDKRYNDIYNPSPYHIKFCVGVAHGQLYFENSYNPFIQSLNNPEILKTEFDTLKTNPLNQKPKFKITDYLTTEFYLKLLSTIATETLMLLLLSFFFNSIKKKKIIQLIAVCALVSIITLPILWFIWPLLIKERILYIWTGETMVIIIEAFLYRKLLKINIKDAFIISAVCNIFSCLIGLLF